jgi:hypothetical protein
VHGCVTTLLAMRRLALHLLQHSTNDTSRGSSVSIMTVLRARRPGFCSRQGQGKVFISLHHCVRICCEAHPASYSMGTTGALFPGVYRPKREADHSPSSRAEVKNARSCNITPPPYMVLAWYLIKYRGVTFY